MYKGRRVLALIPARGGSKRLPGKNLMQLRGAPLIVWSIKAAIRCELVDDVFVSTDDAEIAKVAEEAGAKVLKRSPELAQDTTPSLPVFQDALNRITPKAEVLVVLQPTSPFHPDDQISTAITRLIDEEADAIVAVSKAKMGPEWMLYLEDGKLQIPQENSLERSRTQDQSTRYLLNGALYAYTASTVLASEKYAWGQKTLALIVEKPFDTDIDQLTDFRIANAIAHEFDFNS